MKIAKEPGIVLNHQQTNIKTSLWFHKDAELLRFEDFCLWAEVYVASSQEHKPTFGVTVIRIYYTQWKISHEEVWLSLLHMQL